MRWATKEVGTAPFPKAKEYQQLKIGAYNQEEDSESDIDLYATDEGSSDEDQQVSESEMTDKGSSEEDHQEEQLDDELLERFSDHESEQQASVSPERNWWDEYGADTE